MPQSVELTKRLLALPKSPTDKIANRIAMRLRYLLLPGEQRTHVRLAHTLASDCHLITIPALFQRHSNTEECNVAKDGTSSLT